MIVSDFHRLWYQSWPFDWCKLYEGIRAIEGDFKSEDGGPYAYQTRLG